MVEVPDELASLTSADQRLGSVLVITFLQGVLGGAVIVFDRLIVSIEILVGTSGVEKDISLQGGIFRVPGQL